MKKHRGGGNPRQPLRITPLGGQEEVGRNMTVYEYDGDIVILDMGIQFPEEDMPGIDYIIPNISSLKGRESKVRGIIFSHGHLDHIGAAPLLLEKLGYPVIIGRPLTLALIKRRLEDHAKGSSKKLKTIVVKSIQDTVKLGKFSVKFFQVDHSIMDAVGVSILTPQGTVIHPGDWTYEKKPVGRAAVTYHHLAKLPRPTILMLESLGATSRTLRTPEHIMYGNLEKLMREAPGRIIIGTFSSQLERIRQVIEYAKKINKKVALDGFSMKMNVDIAKELGYIKVGKKTLIDIRQANSIPDRNLIILCTGAQGEGNAVLSRIVTGDHRFIKLKRQDTVVFSSSVIPGNERTIQRLKDNLYRLCDNVIHTEIMDVHSGGHSNAEDIVEIVRQIRPSFFLPVYANHYMLREAAKLVERKNRFPRNGIFVLDNGSTLELQNKKARVLPKKVPTDYVFVDGLGVGDVSNVVLRDRQMLAADGIFMIVVTIDGKTGSLIGEPDIISRGFIYMKESRELLKQVRAKVKKICIDKEPRAQADDVYIKNKIRDQIGQFLFTKTERRPMVMPMVIEI
ncbi:MAG: ribonuclease J [Patescibacteria group bacterium]